MPAKTYTYDHSVLSREDATSFYLLGCYCSDGNILLKNKSGTVNGASFSITSADEDWIQLIRELLRSNHNYRKEKNCFKLKINDQANIGWFLKWGCTPAKSRTIELPAVPEIYFRDFVRGILDGDGWVFRTSDKKKNKIYRYLRAGICSGSLTFSEELNQKLTALGLAPKMSVAHHPPQKNGTPGNDVYRLNYNSESAIKFLNWIYYSDELPKMSRKFNIYRDALTNT